ncbi:hypothetical protein Tco_1561040, partial [Tanacetum coccineum]
MRSPTLHTLKDGPACELGHDLIITRFLARASLRSAGLKGVESRGILLVFRPNSAPPLLRAGSLYVFAFFFFAFDETWGSRDVIAEIGFSSGDSELHVSVLCVVAAVTTLCATTSIRSCGGLGHVVGFQRGLLCQFLLQATSALGIISLTCSSTRFNPLVTYRPGL